MILFHIDERVRVIKNQTSFTLNLSLLPLLANKNILENAEKTRVELNYCGTNYSIFPHFANYYKEIQIKKARKVILCYKKIREGIFENTTQI